MFGNVCARPEDNQPAGGLFGYGYAWINYQRAICPC